ncbi:hypothetical protein BJ944DRAFT_229025, partial [Cunninghamella echinulata]
MIKKKLLISFFLLPIFHFISIEIIKNKKSNMAAVENNYQVKLNLSKSFFNDNRKHAVHYFDQMESKVLQATNMDAWGAPSSLMRSIADGTKDTEKLNIIMPAIYRRFIVKETRLWLQVYK